MSELEICNNSHSFEKKNVLGTSQSIYVGKPNDDSAEIFEGQEQIQFENKKLANREMIDETAIEQISRMIDKVLKQKNASENVKNIFLSLTSVLHHLYLYKKR